MADLDRTPDARARMTFAALARGFRTATEAVRGPGVRFGSSGVLVYGASWLEIPGLNRVMTLDAAAVPAAEDVDAALDCVSHAPVVTWWIPPGSAAAETEARIVHRGFVDDPDDDSAPAMWLELAGLPEPDLGPGVTIEPAMSVAAVHAATLVAGEGFGMPATLGVRLADLIARIGDQPAGASRAFLARLDGRPVASALAVVDRDAVVIYTVATVPDARGRGIGAGITVAALRDARSRGATLGVLESSEMGYGVYRRIGFRDAGSFRILVRRRPPVGSA